MGMESIEDPQGRVVARQMQQMDPAQQQQYMQQQVGLVPMWKLFAVQKEVERLKAGAPPTAPQQPTTVAEDLETEKSQLESQGNGIASLPNPVMENAKFAGGGVVAFAGEGASVVEGATSAAEATQEAAELAQKAAAGKATPAELTRLQKLRAFISNAKGTLTSDVTAKGVKTAFGAPGRAVAGRALARGVTLAGGALGSTGLPVALGSVAKARWEQNDVPIEYLRAFYGGDAFGGTGDTSQYWQNLDTPDKGDKVYQTEGTPLGEAAYRARAGIGKALDTVSFGLAGVDPYSQYFQEAAARQQKPATAPVEEKPKVAGPDISPYMYEDSGIASLGADVRMRNPARGILSGMENEDPIAVPTEEEEVARIRKRNTEAGIGKADEAQLAELDKERGALKEDKRSGSWMALADGFFKMAQSASQPGATLMGSAAEGAITGMKEYRSLLDEIKADERQIKKDTYALNKAQEQGKLGEFSEAGTNVTRIQARRDKQVSDLRENRMKLAQIDAQMAIAAMDVTSREKIARIAHTAKGPELVSVVTRIMQSNNTRAQKDALVAEAIAQYTAMANADPSVISTDKRLKAAQAAAGFGPGSNAAPGGAANSEVRAQADAIIGQ